MGEIRVIEPGMLTTIQDRGRWGFQASGVPVAGPMDLCSHRLANLLVGNGADAATLEITLLGPELEFEDERTIAVAGAEFEVSVDDRIIPTHRAVRVRGGGRLRFGRRARGARAYIAIAGGIDVPPTLGSRATHLNSGMGGLEGRPLRAGDRLPLGCAGTSRPALCDGRPPMLPLSDGRARLRVLAGPHDEAFTPDAFSTLRTASYTISSRSDRMGFRLDGPTLTHACGADIISDATPPGALQVPPSGRPILLMVDRPTTGGYPIIATVISADLTLAGQLGPGDTMTFVACSLGEAVAALIAQERALLAVQDAVSS
jgi:antagonist of KipI